MRYRSGMSLFIIAVAASAATYFPPTTPDAARAVAKRFAEDRFGGDVDAFGVVYPADIRLERCEPVMERAVRNDHGLWQSFTGHDCIMTVSLGAYPDYKVQGFFHYDGLEWSYYGPVHPPLVVQPETFDKYRKGSTQTAKPGATLYNGRAGIGDMPDPYDRVLRGFDVFLEPAEQPYRADIYSTEK